MRFTFTLAILLAACSTHAQNDCKSIDDIAFMERLGHERLANRGNATESSNNFDIKYYRLEWEVDPAIRFITGKITAYYTLLSPSTSVTFDLMNGLITDSVRQRNATLAFQHASNVLTINFPGTVNTGVLDSLAIYYHGVPPNTGFGSFVQTTHGAGVPIIWTLSEPYGSRDWWPCKNGLDDKADSIDVYITNPAAYKAASNGLLQSETLISSGTKRLTGWKHRYPIASYLIAFAVTNYVVLNHSVQLGPVTLPMQTHCYPESQGSFQNNTQNVLNALQQFHNLVGEYPFIKEKYGHVQFSWGGGMEHQTATFLVNTGESLMAHELAHQWFGDKITCGSWVDIWLNEGFATHLASIYMESKYPASAIPTRKAEIDYISSQTGGSVKVNDTTSVGRIFDGRLSYTKGSHLLYMLRWILGDSIFFKGIRQYVKDPALSYRFALNDDLKRNLEQSSGRDLTEFFNDWYAGQGYPSYKVEWYPMGSQYVRIKMDQTTSHASVNFFELPVPLLFRKGTQEKSVVVDNKFKGEEFIRHIGFEPDTVFVDPEYWLITRNNTTKKITDPAAGSGGLVVFPNPIGDQFFVYMRNLGAGPAQIRIHNSLGQLVYSRSVPLFNGSEFLDIPSQGLAGGIYYLQVRTPDGSMHVKKLLK